MTLTSINLLLADNDMDDCFLFTEALKEIAFAGKFTTVNDGDQLMKFLIASKDALPDLIFLDLNMPRKNGFECLTEIMFNEELRHLQVIIFSTSFEPNRIEQLFKDGAKYYIQKPAEFSRLKHVIQQAIDLSQKADNSKTTRETFILHP